MLTGYSMIYSNPEFLFLLFFTLIAFFLCKRSFIGRFYVLLISSLLFYSWAGVFDFFIFIFILIVSWLSMYIAFSFPAWRRLALITGIVIMGAHLFFWKYAPWISSSIQILFPNFLSGKKVYLPLPIGISFFTLQGVAYLVDFYRYKAEFIPFRNYVLFKSFFPQLVSGPIVRSTQLAPQIEKLSLPNQSLFLEGVSLFVLGFFKKIAIADRVAPLVDQAFSNPNNYNRLGLIQGVLAYSVQIWGDFSGYTDMGRGIAKMFGIILPENFFSPYLSKTPSEFWQRWHVTLSLWIRDYIYIPLGGSRGKPLRVIIVALTTMLISGLWHGAAFTFMLWGAYHGMLLVIERLLVKSSIYHYISKFLPAKIINISSIFIMFIATAFGWLIFRAQSMDILRNYIFAIIKNSGKETLSSSTLNFSIITCIVLQVLMYYSFSKNKFILLSPIKNGLLKWAESSKSKYRLSVLGILAGVLLASIYILTIFLRSSTNSQQFIYFQF